MAQREWTEFGARSEIAIALDLMRQGWQVFRNLAPVGKTDLVAVKSGVTIRVQCKSSMNGRTVARHLATRENFLGNDIVAVLVADQVSYFCKPRQKHRYSRLLNSCSVVYKRRPECRSKRHGKAVAKKAA